MDLIEVEDECQCKTVRLKLPNKFQALTEEDINIINVECIKTKDGAVLIKDDQIGIYVAGIGIGENIDTNKLVEETIRITKNALKKYTKKDKK